MLFLISWLPNNQEGLAVEVTESGSGVELAKALPGGIQGFRKKNKIAVLI